MPNLNDILQIIPLVQSHAWVALAIVLIGLVSKLLSGETPGPRLPVRVRVGVVIALSGTTATLEAVQSHRPIVDAVISGVVVIFAALAAHDGEALRELLGQGAPPASGAGGSKDVPTAPKAAPPGTFRTAYRDNAVRASGRRSVPLIAYVYEYSRRARLALRFCWRELFAIGVASAIIVALSGCAAFSKTAKTALNDVEIACVLEQAAGLGNVLPEQEATIVAGICHLDEAAIPLVANVLSAHRRAEAREIVAGAAKPCPGK